ncbi:MAG TPA: EAL domain-containing protein [Actinomycetota bacterium]|nr:EAL domain-containing protein [Actinomycetota bacterium]
MSNPRDASHVQELLERFVDVLWIREVPELLQQVLELSLFASFGDKGAVWLDRRGERVGLEAAGIEETEIEPLKADGSRASHVLISHIETDGELAGGICVVRDAGHPPFDELDRGLVSALALQVSSALSTIDLLENRNKDDERLTEANFSFLARHSSEMTTLLDEGGIVRYCGLSVEKILGYKPGSLIGSDALELVHPDDRSTVRAIFKKAMQESGTAAFECRVRHSDGYWLHTDSSLNSLLDDPEVGGVLFNTRDATERKALEEELAHAALHDPLTALPNRGLFRDRVEHALARAERHDRPVGVLFIDLDDFKKINDSDGHAKGDLLLSAVAERLRDNLRGPDTAARLGGDEFALLLEDIRQRDDALLVADRIQQSMEDPFYLDDLELEVRASIGVAVGTPREHNADDLIRDADVAMFTAKSRGKAQSVVFEQSMHENLLERVGLETDLRRAAQNGEFVVYYQPTVRLATGAIAGMEALVRWQHPRRGLVPPGDFIPLAEETGLIVGIGRFVLGEACRQAREWQLRFPDNPFSIAVNLSARQLQHQGLLQEVIDALESSALPPESLVLEITESVLMEHTEEVVATLHSLKDLGVRLAIDDFGTGYSSLSYLQKLPVDILKIDRSFVSGLSTGSQELAVTRAIIELGQSLELQTLAEGIELAEQLMHLKSLHCDMCQGFYFAKPLETTAMEALLTSAASGESWGGAMELETQATELPAS